MKNNIAVAKTSSQLCLVARSLENDFNLFGTFDDNYYSRPVDDNKTISTLVNTWTNTYRTLSEWQAYSRQDANSKKSPQSITNVNELQFEFNATKSPKTVSLSQPMIDVKGTKYSSSVTLQPFTSVVLLKDKNPDLSDVTNPVITNFSIPSASSSLTVAITSLTATDNKGVTGYIISESPTGPLASGPGWSISAPASFTFASEGIKTLYAWAKDAAGNVSARASAQVNISLPVNTGNNIGNTDVYSNTITWGNQLAMPVTFTETGAIISISIFHNGGTGNFLLGVYSNQSGSPASRLGITASTVVNSSAGWQTVQLTSPVPVTSGQTVWLSWVFQNTPGLRYTTGTPGRAASSYTWANGMPATFGTSTIAGTKYSIYCTYSSQTNPVDVTAPVVTAFNVPANSSLLTIPVTSFNATDNSGVTGYMITESATAPLAANSSWSVSAPASYTFASEGTKTLYAWAKDAAGNVSASLNAQVTVTLPVFSLGNTEVYSSTITWANQLAMPVTFTTAGEIKSISIYHEGGSGNFLLGVYSDQGGLPSSRLGITASTTVNAGAGWQTVALTNPLPVIAGQKVWLSWVFQNTPGLRYTAGTPGRAASSFTWANGMPVSFGSSTVAGNKYSIYCTYSTQNNPVDLTAPVITAFNIPATSTSLTVPVNSFTATDNLSVTGYLITESATAPAASNTAWSVSAPVSYTFTSEGTKTLYAWAKDAAGNVSAGVSAQVTVAVPDVTKPVVTAFTVPSASTSLTISVTSFNASDNKGVTGYMITESAAAPLAANSSWSVSAPASYTFASEGTKTLYAWAKDAAGNVSASLNAQVTVTLPVFSLGNTEVYSSTITWANQLAMPVTFTTAGEIKSISIYHEGGSGNFLLGVYSDQGGLPSSRLGITASTTVNAGAGWQTVALTNPLPVIAGQKVWLSWVFQNTPGLRYTAGTPGRAASSFTWANGMPASFGSSTVAGNKYSIYCTYSTQNNPVDLTAPVITAFNIPATSTSLTVPVNSFTATDNLSVTGYLITESATAPAASNTAWSVSAPVSYTFTSEGTKTLYAWAKDAAGNVSAGVSAQVTVAVPDVTKPVVTAFTVPSASTSLTISVTSFNASDNKGVTGYMITESAAAPLAANSSWSVSAPASYTFASEGTKTLYAWAKDAAGNVSASLNAQVTVTLPVFSLGNTEVYSSTITWANQLAMPVTFTTAGEIKSISIYHQGGSGNFLLGVYSDQGGLPSSRLGITASTTVNAGAGWQTVALSNPLPVIAGQKVWLSWVFQNTPVLRYTAGTPGRAASSFTWANGMPASFGSSTIAGNKYSIYCTYSTQNNPVDLTAPVLTAFNIPATSSSLTIPVNSLTASDNISVTGYKLTETATAPSPEDAGWSADAPASYTFASQGAKTLYAWAIDAAGNVSLSLSAQVSITLPVFPLGNTEVYGSSITWVNQLAMPVTFTAAGEIKSISIYHEGGSGNFLLGVYSDQGDFPSSRLGITASTVVNPTAGWQTVQLSNPVPVISGQTVWLSWVFQNNPGIRYTAGTPGRAASSNTWANGMPASFGTSTIAPNKYSIYCSYSVNPNILKDANLSGVTENESVRTISDNENKEISVEKSVNALAINDFKLYPNPANSVINVEFSVMPEQGTLIEIIDSNGRTLYKKPAESVSNRIDISHIPIGLYFVRCANNHKFVVKKLIIK
jgi:hypothetical protein